MRIITRTDVENAKEEREGLQKKLDELEQRKGERGQQLAGVQVAVEREVPPELKDLDKEIETVKQQLAALPAEGDINNDSYIQKVQAYIPAAIVAAYVALDQLIKSAVNIPTTLVYTVVFVILLVITPFYVWKGTTKKVKSISWPQIIIATIGIYCVGVRFRGAFHSLILVSTLLWRSCTNILRVDSPIVRSN